MKKRTRLLMIALLFLLCLIFCGLLNALAPGTLAPDYAPRQTEEYAVPLEEESEVEKMEMEEGGGAVSITYSMGVNISLQNQIANLYFANPSKSNSNMVLRIVVQNQVLAQSGLILTGHEIETLTLKKGIEKKLVPGGYEGKMVVTFYDPVTREKANVTTEIPITVEVGE